MLQSLLIKIISILASVPYCLHRIFEMAKRGRCEHKMATASLSRTVADQHNFDRIESTLKGTLHIDGVPTPANVINISPGGARVTCSHSFGGGQPACDSTLMLWQLRVMCDSAVKTESSPYCSCPKTQSELRLSINSPNFVEMERPRGQSRRHERTPAMLLAILL